MIREIFARLGQRTQAPRRPKKIDAKPASIFLEKMTRDALIDEPVVVVAAHPDDETIGMGGRLSKFANLKLIHVTDGAPQDLVRAKQLGFSTPTEYSNTRFRELQNALSILGVTPISHRCYRYKDGDVSSLLLDLVDLLESELETASAVLSHAYEGGHPDHDGCAFAIQAACNRLSRRGRKAPARLEFLGYHSLRGRFYSAAFWPEPEHAALTIRLSRQERLRKMKAMRAFHSQAWIMSAFKASKEMYRDAPYYDFRAPPPPGQWLYDKNGWAIKGETWLKQARSALDLLP